MEAISPVTASPLVSVRHQHVGQFGPEPVRDQAGKVLIGATALVMEEDGVTPVTLFADRDRSAVLDNPVLVDQAGTVRFFADPGVHILKIDHQGVTVQQTTIVVPVDPEDAIRQPEMVLHVDDFGCVPDGRFLERVSIAGGSTVLTDHNGSLRATDVKKSVAIPGAIDLVATIEELGGKEIVSASMNAGNNRLTASFAAPNQGFRAIVHVGRRITVTDAGPGGNELLTDVTAVINATTLELAEPASTTVTGVEAILNDPQRVVLSDYARRTVKGVTVDLGDRIINDGSMTVGAKEEGLVSKTAKFSSLDLDKTVNIHAAGLLLTSIQSFKPPTAATPAQVTLAAQADRAVVQGQADVWKTDSRPGLERLLASLKQRDVEAAEIRCGSGVYDFRRIAPLNLAQGVIDLRDLRNLTLRGSGAGATVLRLMPGQELANTHVIETRNCTNLTLSDLSVHGAYLTMGTVNEQMHGIQVNEGSEEIVVERVRVFQTAGDGIRFVGAPTNTARKIWVQGCRFIQNKRTGVSFQRGAERVWIRNNYIEMTPPSTDACVDFEPSRGSDFPPTDIVIDSNIMVHRNATVAVSISGIPPTTDTGVEPALRVKFANNILVGGPVLCTDIDQLTIQNNVVVVTADAPVDNRIIRIPLQVQRGGRSLLITGNLLVSEEVASPTVVEEAVISLTEVNQRSVTRAMVMGNMCCARSGSGIELRSSDDVAVEANMVVATGSCTEGIFVRSESSDVDNVSIRNNDITIEGTGSWTDGIVLSATGHEIHHVSVVGNSITGARTGVHFGGVGFRQTPVCSLNRIGSGVQNPLVGLRSLPHEMMVIGGAASRGGTAAESGVGRFLIGHGSPDRKVAERRGHLPTRRFPRRAKAVRQGIGCAAHYRLGRQIELLPASPFSVPDRWRLGLSTTTQSHRRRLS